MPPLSAPAPTFSARFELAKLVNANLSKAAYSPLANTLINALAGCGSHLAHAVADRIYRSNDGGATWANVAPVAGQDYTALDFVWQAAGVGNCFLLGVTAQGALGRIVVSGGSWGGGGAQLAAPGALYDIAVADQVNHGLAASDFNTVTVQTILAVGTDELIMRSADSGLTWAVARAAGTSNDDLSSVCKGAGQQWLAVGIPQAGGTFRLLSNDDGTTWTKLVGAAGEMPYKVRYGQGRYVGPAFNSNVLLSSADGSVFANIFTAPRGIIKDVAFDGQDTWVITTNVGQMWASTDLIEWFAAPFTGWGFTAGTPAVLADYVIDKIVFSSCGQYAPNGQQWFTAAHRLAPADYPLLKSQLIYPSY